MREFVFAVVVIVACSGTQRGADSTVMNESVTIRADKQSYRPGESVTVTIVSTSTAQHTYNPCQRIVERESAGSWTPVREERMCTMIAHLLEPKQTRTEQTEMADGIEPGRYRLVILFAEESSTGASRSVRAATAPLTVVR